MGNTKRSLLLLLVVLMSVSSLFLGGSYAAWQYSVEADPTSVDTSLALSGFHYGEIYITKIEKRSFPSDHTSAEVKKISTTTVDSNIVLSSSSTSSASFD
ncbi:MAG: hypothetical protein IKL40_02335, partial [Clostridia bacterium]|nr:hypothetical protein [Clostridia bacterium]